MLGTVRNWLIIIHKTIETVKTKSTDINLKHDVTEKTLRFISVVY